MAGTNFSEEDCRLMDDCFQLNWHGKEESFQVSQTPAKGTLIPCREESRNWNATGNLYLEGDNLEILKLLQPEFGGRIRMIYIDPPYNTGKDFIYSDNFYDSKTQYWKKTGAKHQTNGRYHTGWLNMMYPRLLLAYSLLAEDGVIFLSIDDNELDNLKKICGEVFGEDNYINLITVKTKTSSGASGGGEDKRLKKNTEYVLMYAKNKDKMILRQPTEKIRISDYIREHRSAGIGFYYTRILEDEGKKELLCERDGLKIYVHRHFRFSTVNEKRKQENLSEDEVYSRYFSKIFMVTNAQTSLLIKVNQVTPENRMLISYEYVPKTGRSKGKRITKYVWNKTLIVWLSDSAVKEKNRVYKRAALGTLWDDISWGRLDLEGEVPFKNGKKPLKLLDRMLSMVTDRDSVVLDFFSGSATTAHAVMNRNAQDGGSRRFIMVQLPEPIDQSDAAYRKGYRTICEIGKERIRKAGDALISEYGASSAGDTGFRVYRLNLVEDECGENQDRQREKENAAK
ncbi:MAG: site-specific DNA-methyltransferase [Ruminococcaceae bacterium]|nr:site-specific DNA-methyltransferase [Oscillospiraceae bacterium]